MNRKRKKKPQWYADIPCYIVIALSIVVLMWAALISIGAGEQNQEPVHPLPETETDTRSILIETDIPVEVRMTSAHKNQQSGSKLVVEAPQSEPLYLESDAKMLAKLMFVECGGIPSDTEKACVVWTVLNRADAWDMSIQNVITSANQFAYSDKAPITEKLYALALDVLNRWSAEKNGTADVGRVLPKEYMWFWGDGKHNHFRDAFSGTFTVWDYSLHSPYDN